MNQLDGGDTDRLLRAYSQGNQSAMADLLNRYRPYMRGIIEGQIDERMRGRLDTSDLIQEAQIEVARRLDDFVQRRPMPFRNWLHRTVRQRMAIAWRRHRQAKRRSLDREVSLDQQNSDVLGKARPAESPSHFVENQELTESVRKAMAKLADIDREIILFRNFDFLSNSEAAKSLGITEQAANKRYSRALQRLALLLGAT